MFFFFPYRLRIFFYSVGKNESIKVSHSKQQNIFIRFVNQGQTLNQTEDFHKGNTREFDRSLGKIRCELQINVNR